MDIALLISQRYPTECHANQYIKTIGLSSELKLTKRVQRILKTTTNSNRSSSHKNITI
jgi:hypothetical protein